MPYITGDTPTASLCYQVTVPDDLYFIAAFKGALLSLTDPANWEQVSGSLSPDDAAALALDLYDSLTECP